MILLLATLLPVRDLVAQVDTIPSIELGVVIIPEIIYPDLSGSYIQRLDSAAKHHYFHRNLDALMAEAPSVYIKNYGLGGIATPAFRGTGAGHTQIYWEGIPLNASTLGLQDFSLVSSALIDKVELLYGGGSLIEGSGGLGGAITLANEKWDAKWKTGYRHKISQEIGSFSSFRTAYNANYAGQKLAGSTRFSYATAKNDFHFVNTAQAGSPEQRQSNAALRQFSFLQSITSRRGFYASIWAYDTDRQLPPTMLTRNNREKQRDRGIRTLAGWRSQVLGRYRLNLQGAYFSESMLYEHPIAQIYAPSSAERLAFRAKFHTKVAPGLQKISFQGASLRIVHDRAKTDGFPNSRQRTTATAAARASYQIAQKHGLSLLLREELIDQDWSPLLGYLGLGGTFLQNFQYQASFSRNYRQPTLNDRYWIPGGNPNLQPESSWSADANMRWQSSRQKRIQAEFRLGTFGNLVDNWILWLPGTGAIWSPENVNQVFARGLEAEMGLKKKHGPFQFDLIASWSWTQSQVQDAGSAHDPSLGKQLIYTPVHAGKAHINLRRGKNHLSYKHQFTGARFTTRDNSESVAGFSLGNLQMGRFFQTAHSILILEAGIDNLWNVAYQNIAWRAMPGRSFFLRLQWELNPGK